MSVAMRSAGIASRLRRSVVIPSSCRAARGFVRLGGGRLRLLNDFFRHLVCLRLAAQGHRLIVCGDLNTAHQPIDLARPGQNKKTSGFLPEERAWIDRFLADGFIDTFRMMCDEPGQYSWWDYKTRARERNIGWRIEYFFVSENLRKKVKNAWILSDVPGSDHCPIGLSTTV